MTNNDIFFIKKYLKFKFGDDVYYNMHYTVVDIVRIVYLIKDESNKVSKYSNLYIHVDEVKCIIRKMKIKDILDAANK